MEVPKFYFGEKCADISRLIAHSAIEVVQYIYTSKHKTAESFIDYAYHRDSNFFSYDIHHFIRVNNQAAGCFATYTADEFTELSFGFLRCLLSFYGLIEGLRPLYRAVKLSKLTPPPPKDALYICNLCICPKFRRLGLGKLLMTRAIQFSEEKGFTKACLDVSIANTHALTLYEKLGFRIASKNIMNDYKMNNYKGPIEGNYRMIRQNKSVTIQ